MAQWLYLTRARPQKLNVPGRNLHSLSPNHSLANGSTPGKAATKRPVNELLKHLNSWIGNPALNLVDVLLSELVADGGRLKFAPRPVHACKPLIFVSRHRPATFSNLSILPCHADHVGSFLRDRP